MILGLIFDRFLVDFGIENRWKIDEKSIKKQIKNKMRFGIDFWWLLGGFWEGFGGQVGTKIDQKSKLKKACNKDDVRELLNVKILGQSGAWELLKVKKSEKNPTGEFQESGSGEYEGLKTPQL